MIELRQIGDGFTALGIAVHFMAQREPFDGFRARELVDTLDGQIRRRHFLFAFQGRKVTGYAGWALIDRPTAERIAAGGEVPSNAAVDGLARSGDVLWVMTTASTDDASAIRMMRGLRDAHPDFEVLAIRRYADGRSRPLRLRLRKGNAASPSDAQRPQSGEDVAQT